MKVVVKDIFKAVNHLDTESLIEALIDWYVDNSSRHLEMHIFFRDFPGRSYYEQVGGDLDVPKTEVVLSDRSASPLQSISRVTTMGVEEVAYWAYIYAAVWLGHHKEPFTLREQHAPFAKSAP